MGGKEKQPELRFKGFSGDWEEREYSETFTKIPNNTLSRAELNYNSGLAKNVHYGDVLIKYGELLDVTKDEIPYITDEALVYKFRSSKLQSGDVIIADAAEDETVGKCTELVNVGEEIVISGLHTIPSRPTLTFASGYLGYFMNSSAYHTQLLRLMQGTKVSSISKAVLQDTAIFYPIDRVEQCKISKIFQQLNNLITLQQRKVDKLKNIKKSMLEKMFPKKGALLPEIRFKGFTDAWEQRELGEVLTERKILQKITDDAPVLAFASGQGVIDRSERKSNNRDHLTLDQINKIYLLTEYNDIVYNPSNLKYGAIDRNKYRKGVISPIYVTFTTEEEPSFIELIVKSEKFKLRALLFEEGTVVKRQSVKPKNLLTLEVNISSSRDEQKKIGALFAHLDNLITLHQRKLEKLKNIKKSCLDKMFV